MIKVKEGSGFTVIVIITYFLPPSPGDGRQYPTLGIAYVWRVSCECPLLEGRVDTNKTRWPPGAAEAKAIGRGH